jgi:hypothetical protein
VAVSTHSPVTYYTQVREIYKPIGDTILVANELGAVQASSKWTLDEANGTVDPNGTFTGTPTFWGGEFDVEVRFMEDQLNLEVSTFGTRNVRFGMREKRREATT